MKITAIDYKRLKVALAPITSKHDFFDIMQDYKNAGKTPRGFRWAAFRASGVKLGDGVGMFGDLNLYAYLNDEHIDSALRQIMRDVGAAWAAQTEAYAHTHKLPVHMGDRPIRKRLRN